MQNKRMHRQQRPAATAHPLNTTLSVSNLDIVSGRYVCDSCGRQYILSDRSGKASVAQKHRGLALQHGASKRVAPLLL